MDAVIFFCCDIRRSGDKNSKGASPLGSRGAPGVNKRSLASDFRVQRCE